jgi:uncharacterized glyoxalase superfamily protein PhnB
MTASTTATTATATIAPFLRYSDPHAALAWLETVLGFKKVVAFPSEDGGIAHAEMRMGDAWIMLGSTGASSLGMASPRELPAVNQGIYLAVADAATVDAIHERALANGAEIIVALNDTDYGSHEFTMRDLEGHLWSLGTYWPGSDA